MVGANNGVELTEQEAELYDRQIRLWGLESQKRLRAAKILLCGVNGLGAEITKNIVLAGVKSLVLLDDKKVQESDSFSQFLAPRSAIGENRAQASLHRARVLNPTVDITADTESLENKDEKFFKEFDIVVVTEATTKEILRVDALCRENNVKFFSCDVWGMFGYAFTDLKEHEFAEDVVKHKVISEPQAKIKTETVTTTAIRNLTFPSFQVVLDFDYKSPQYIKKMKKCGPWFIVMRILQCFRDKFGRDPEGVKRDEDMKAILEIRDEIANKELVDDIVFTHVFNQISPVAAIVGGEVSQEIIKTASQKESPHRNVFLFEPETCCGFIEDIGGEN